MRIPVIHNIRGNKAIVPYYSRLIDDEESDLPFPDGETGRLVISSSPDKKVPKRIFYLEDWEELPSGLDYLLDASQLEDVKNLDITPIRLIDAYYTRIGLITITKDIGGKFYGKRLSKIEDGKIQIFEQNDRRFKELIWDEIPNFPKEEVWVAGKEFGAIKYNALIPFESAKSYEGVVIDPFGKIEERLKKAGIKFHKVVYIIECSTFFDEWSSSDYIQSQFRAETVFKVDNFVIKEDIWEDFAFDRIKVGCWEEAVVRKIELLLKEVPIHE